VEAVEDICATESEDWHTRRLAYDPATVVNPADRS
jgi:hypothetical protein